MLVIGSIADTDDVQEEDDVAPYTAGTLYELQACPSCESLNLVGGPWHEGMDEPDDWSHAVVLPAANSTAAHALLEQQRLDDLCMSRAVEAARKCESEGDVPKPKVAAVFLRNGEPVVAYRGELKSGEHAEYTLLEGKAQSDKLAGATVYTTLEPCTTRNHPKKPCVERLIARKVARVVVGMLDPDERIRGLGILALRKANIRVDLFPPNFMMELEEMNRDFIASRETAGRAASTPVVVPSPTSVRGFSNHQDPKLACFEFLRLENINAEWTEVHRAHLSRIMVDGAGEKLGWHALAVTRTSLDDLQRELAVFANESPAVRREQGLSQHSLVLVACDGTAADNAQLAEDIVAQCARRPSLDIRVCIGFFAHGLFVPQVSTHA